MACIAADEKARAWQGHVTTPRLPMVPKSTVGKRLIGTLGRLGNQAAKIIRLLATLYVFKEEFP